jgi:hypothetical protein
VRDAEWLLEHSEVTTASQAFVWKYWTDVTKSAFEPGLAPGMKRMALLLSQAQARVQGASNARLEMAKAREVRG